MFALWFRSFLWFARRLDVLPSTEFHFLINFDQIFFFFISNSFTIQGPNINKISTPNLLSPNPTHMIRIHVLWNSKLRIMCFSNKRGLDLWHVFAAHVSSRTALHSEASLQFSKIALHYFTSIFFLSEARKVLFPYGFVFFLRVCAPTVVSLNSSFDQFWSFSRPWFPRAIVPRIYQFHLFLCSRMSVIIVDLSHVLACAIKFQI